MSGDGDDFFHLDEREDGGEGPVVSRDAFSLHGFAIVNSVRDGTPGFISDEYLNAISAETTTTAAELCLAGLWERADGGYRINDPMIEDAVRFHDRMEVGKAECAERGSHSPDPENEFCTDCLAPLDRK